METIPFLPYLLFLFLFLFLSTARCDYASICESRLARFGYYCEEHTVTTKDGYMLNLQRIPQGRSEKSEGKQKKIPVLLQHGLFMDGFTWLLNSPNESLGYILADRGFDVWIINSRGTAFSRQHTKLSVNDTAYWSWSWDELVAYDLPATYEYVYRYSGRQKIHFVGHSLGTLMGLAAFSQRRLIGMTRSASLLCPIAYLNNLKSVLARSAADVFLADTYYWLGLDEFRPVSKPVRSLLKKLCKQPLVDCFDLLTSFTGKNCCMNNASVQIFLKHEPQATSTKNVVHISQMIRKGTIAKFDYDDYQLNMINYGKPSPPSYDISAGPQDLPLFISYGGKDSLSDVDDVKHLLTLLHRHDKKKMTVQFQPNYAHGDYVVGVNADRFVYETLISFLRLN